MSKTESESAPLLVARVTARGLGRADLVNSLQIAVEAIEGSGNDSDPQSAGMIEGLRWWEYTITEGEPEPDAPTPAYEELRLRAARYQNEIACLRAQLAACQQPDGGSEMHRRDLRALFGSFEEADRPMQIARSDYEKHAAAMDKAVAKMQKARTALLAALEGR